MAPHTWRMIVILRGADELAIHRRLGELKTEADGGSGMLATNFLSIEGREAKPEEIIGPAMTPPFLAPKRLVLVERLIERFDPRPPAFQARSIGAFASLLTQLEKGFPATTTLVFTAGEVRPRNPLLEGLKKITGTLDEEFAEMKGEPLFRWIRDEANARGIRFRTGPFREHRLFDEQLEKVSDPAVLLSELVRYEIRPDSNEWRSDSLGLTNELDKLANYSMGHEVTVDTVYEVCSGARHTTNFVLLDAMLDGNLGRALEALAILVRDGVEEQAILGVIGSRYRQMANIVDLVQDGATPEEVGKALGNSGKYQGLRDAAIRRARRLGPAGVREAFEAIVEADRANKSGEGDKTFWLELLVMALTRPQAATARLSPAR